MKKYILTLHFFVVLLGTSCGQNTDNTISTTEKPILSKELVVPDLRNPWGFVFLPDNSLLITEKEGKLILYKDGSKRIIKGLPDIKVAGQGGLLDVALDPQYSSNGYIYLTYVSADGKEKGSNTALLRCKLFNEELIDKKVLYKASPNSTTSHHFGSRIVFDKEGYLYFSIGDRGNRDENPQDITRDGGKIYRLNKDGSIPTDNPFYTETNAKKAVFSYGHRNPQGLVLNPFNGEIWEHEHGPRGGDEINTIKKGKNYGWPSITYGINYSGTKITDKTKMQGMEQPIHYWVPSIAPSGMAFITTNKYPNWKGNLLVGSLAFQYLERLVLKDNKVIYREKLLDGIGRVRSVKEGPDGYVYIGVEGKGIYKLTPKS
ncbi:hypothetical protein BUL40_10960 [Croceivirga radicis]|uniref:Glucose/Sorbosone dehydrogenase domain-containing protein n=1 Tax=Croceivirga radicis TaxID=1929488 RepID=A0A1V6LQ16_9FLAO|nr:PQQ-dependent sugar dehydrogenase [Croceivirga radicis]OQD42281.1 hypothetical protein BUL40_10960 [Croceivirga radicis]